MPRFDIQKRTACRLLLILCSTGILSVRAADNPKGYIVVYRLKKYAGSALTPSVSCDGVLAAKMTNGRFFTLTLDPGPHQLSSSSKNSPLIIKVAPSQIQYVQMVIEPGLAKGHGNLLSIGSDQGAQEITLLRAVETNKIENASVAGTEIPDPGVLAKNAASPSPAQQQPQPTAAEPVAQSQSALDADRILQMKKAGLSDDLVISMGKKNGVAAFTPESVIKMKTAGLSEELLAKLVEMQPKN